MRSLLLSVLTLHLVSCLSMGSACNAQPATFSQLANLMKFERDKVRSFDVEFSQDLTDKIRGARSVVSGQIVADKDAQVLYLKQVKNQLDSQSLRSGIDPSRIDRLNNRLLHLLQCPSGIVSMFDREPPLLLSEAGTSPRGDIDHSLFDVQSLGLAVHGDMNAKFHHDIVLSNLMDWNEPVLTLENGLISCDFGVLKYLIDPATGYWPIAHEYQMSVVKGTLKSAIMSRCEVSLTEVNGKWLPQTVTMETERTVTEIALHWNSVNRDLEDRFTNVFAFADSTGKPLLRVDSDGYRRPVVP